MHEQINFDGFATYLREFRLAEERHIPYLVGWVQRYLRLQVEADLCDEDRLRVYIDSLESDVRLTDWQQRQRQQGSKHPVTRQPGWGAERAFGGSAENSRKRFDGWTRRGLHAEFAGSQISERGT